MPSIWTVRDHAPRPLSQLMLTGAVPIEIAAEIRAALAAGGIVEVNGAPGTGRSTIAAALTELFGASTNVVDYGGTVELTRHGRTPWQGPEDDAARAVVFADTAADTPIPAGTATALRQGLAAGIVVAPSRLQAPDDEPIPQPVAYVTCGRSRGRRGIVEFRAAGGLEITVTRDTEGRVTLATNGARTDWHAEAAMAREFAGAVRIGRQDSPLGEPLRVSITELAEHMVVCGSPGSGHTAFTDSIIAELARRGRDITTIDLTGRAPSAELLEVASSAGRNTTVLTDHGGSTAGLGSLDLLDAMDAVGRFEDTYWHHTLLMALNGAPSAGETPELADYLEALSEACPKNPDEAAILAWFTAQLGQAVARGGDLVDGTLPPFDPLASIAVLNLDPAKDETVALAAAVKTLTALTVEPNPQPRVVLVRVDRTAPRVHRALERLVERARTKGLSVVVDTSAPSELTPGVAANAATKVLFRVASNELDAARGLLPTRDPASNWPLDQTASGTALVLLPRAKRGTPALIEAPHLRRSRVADLAGRRNGERS